MDLNSVNIGTINSKRVGDLFVTGKQGQGIIKSHMFILSHFTYSNFYCKHGYVRLREELLEILKDQFYSINLFQITISLSVLFL